MLEDFQSVILTLWNQYRKVSVIFWTGFTLNLNLHVDYIAAPSGMALYREMSSKIVATYLKFVSIEDLYPYNSIDEVFIDATPYLKTYNMFPHDFAAMMIKDVLN